MGFFAGKEREGAKGAKKILDLVSALVELAVWRRGVGIKYRVLA